MKCYRYALALGIVALTTPASPQQATSSPQQQSPAVAKPAADKQDAAQERPVPVSKKKAATSGSDAEGQSKSVDHTAGESKKTAAGGAANPVMSEAEALPQGTPYVPNLNLFGLSTAELRRRLETALRNDSSLQGSNLAATVTDESILLSGTVASGKERVTATRIAQSFAANRSVKEKITFAQSNQNSIQQTSPGIAPSPASQEKPAANSNPIPKRPEQNSLMPTSEPQSFEPKSDSHQGSSGQSR